MKKRYALILVVTAVLVAAIGIFALKTAYDASRRSGEGFGAVERIELTGNIRADWFRAGGTLNDTEAFAAARRDSAITLLFLGVDRRSKERGRADAIHLLRLETGGMTLISIPRDVLVSLRDDTRPEKINHAYAYGGHALMTRTIEDLLKIKIDGYLEVDLNTFVQMARAAKVLTLDGKLVGAEELFSHIDGWLSWLRNRSLPGGDFRRLARQQLFITKSLDWTLSLYKEHPAVYANACKAILALVPTDITYRQALCMSQIFAAKSESAPVHNEFAVNRAIAGMERFIIPARPVMIDVRTGAELIPDTRLAAAAVEPDSSAPSATRGGNTYAPSAADVPQLSSSAPASASGAAPASPEDTYIISFCKIDQQPFVLRDHLNSWRKRGMGRNYEDQDKLFGDSAAIPGARFRLLN